MCITKKIPPIKRAKNAFKGLIKMLVLQRHVNEKIIIRLSEDDIITIDIHSVISPKGYSLSNSHSVKLAIEANREYWVDREEIYLSKLKWS